MTYGELIRGSRTNEELAEIYCYELDYKDDCPPDFYGVSNEFCNPDNCGFNCWLRYFNKEVKE